MTDKKVIIEFAKLGGPVYIGRPRGEAARKKLNLDDIDRDGSVTVEVIIPADTYSINSSYFLGLFGDSIRAAGSREAFLKKYIFKCEEVIRESSVESGIERALHEHGFILPRKGGK